jgi:hypothetical protein
MKYDRFMTMQVEISDNTRRYCPMRTAAYFKLKQKAMKYSADANRHHNNAK